MKASAVLSEKQYSENLKKQVKAINSILEGGIKNIEVLTSESMFAFLHADTLDGRMSFGLSATKGIWSVQSTGMV